MVLERKTYAAKIADRGLHGMNMAVPSSLHKENVQGLQGEEFEV